MKEYYEVTWKGYSKNSNIMKSNTGNTTTIWAKSRNDAIESVKQNVKNAGYKVTSINARAKKN
jgi:hypothetical protein